MDKYIRKIGAVKVLNAQLLFLEENIQVDLQFLGDRVSIESLKAVRKMVGMYNDVVNDNLRLCAEFANRQGKACGEIVNDSGADK